MDMSVNKAQRQQRDIAAPAAGRPDLATSQDARGQFAAALQKFNVEFNTGGALSFAPKALAAHFERPVQAQRPEPVRQVPRSEPRVRSEDRPKAQAVDRADQPRQAQAPVRRDDRRPVADDQDQTRAASTADTSTADTAKSADDAGPVKTDDQAEAAADQTTDTAGTDVNNASSATVDTGAESLQVVEVFVRTTIQTTIEVTADTAEDAQALAGQAADDLLNMVKTGQNKGQVAETQAGGTQNADADDGQESLFSLQLRLQNAAQQSRQNAARNTAEQNTGANDDQQSLAQSQADMLARTLDDQSRVQIKVATNATDGQTLPQTMSTLVQNAAFISDGFDEGFGAGGQQTGSQTGGNGQGANQNALSQAMTQGTTAVGPETQGQTTAQGQNQSFSDLVKAGAGAATADAGVAQKVQVAPQAGGEGTPQIGGAQATTQTSQTSQAQASSQPQPARPVLPPQPLTDQIKVDISKAVADGNDHISIQLKPEELGRIEIKLDMNQGGRVHAVVTADNPQTLEMLKQDARGLEKALQDAGLSADGSSLSFNLRGDNEQQALQREKNGNGRGKGNGDDSDRQVGDVEDARVTAQLAAQRFASQRGGVDVRI
ncbi:MAG: flagellar hook-length control protein FliK [Alphaproteobacteria bacterium]